MSLLDQLTSFAGQAMGHTQGEAAAPGQQASVAQALVSTLGEHPGGIGGLLEQFKQNGLGGHVDNWVQSDPNQAAPQPLSPEQVQQGTGNTGLIATIAQKTGLPEAAVTMALTTALPLILSHMTPNGQVPQGGQFGGLAQSILSKLV